MDWYYADKDQQVGPLPEEEFDGAIQAGEVLPTTLVWHAGMADWQPYSTLGRQAATSHVALHTAIQSGPQTSCMECGRSFAQADMVRYGDGWICAACKPVFIQKLKEGLRPGERLHYAGFWIRFGAKFIDGILLAVVNMVLGLLFGLSMITSMNNEAMLSALLIGQQILSLALAIGYNVYFLGKFGATPGKMACRIYVSVEDGSPIGYGRAFGRLCAETLSTSPLVIGFFLFVRGYYALSGSLIGLSMALIAIIPGINCLMVAWDPEKRALHDRLCNTRVVRKN